MHHLRHQALAEHIGAGRTRDHAAGDTQAGAKGLEQLGIVLADAVAGGQRHIVLILVLAFGIHPKLFHRFHLGQGGVHLTVGS